MAVGAAAMLHRDATHSAREHETRTGATGKKEWVAVG